MRTMHQRLVRIQAMVMIFLVVTIPLFTANAYAAPELKDVQSSGRDGVTGYVREFNDAVSVTAKAKVDDRTVNPEQLVINYPNPSGTQFDMCTRQSDGFYLCSYTTPTADRQPQVYPFTVSLLDLFGTPVAEASSSFIVDGEDPTIDTFDVEPIAIRENVTLDYAITERACPGCPQNTCAGFKTLDVVSNGETTASFDLTQTATCSLIEQRQTTANTLNLNEGPQDLCIKVIDKFDHEETSCKQVIVDYTPPLFVRGSFKLTDAQGNDVKFSRSSELRVRALVNVTDISTITPQAIVADFSPLKRDQPGLGSVRPSACNPVGTPGTAEQTTVCEWDNLFIKNVGEASIVINATDSVGNFGQLSETINLPVDDQGPVVRAIRTTNNNLLNARNNSIVIELDETGSGVSTRQAFLDLSEIGQGTEVQAQECSQNNGLWECRWLNIPARGNSGDALQIQIRRILDDIGNEYDAAASTTSASFTMDDTLPKIINITVRPKGSDARVITIGDVVEVIAFVEDEHSGISPERAMANFDVFAPGSGLAPADNCASTDSVSQYVCSWEYAGELTPGTGELNVVVTDNAGNTVDSAGQTPRQLGRFTVQEIKELRIVDFWEDLARVDPMNINELNRHFLWMSPRTIQRLNIELIPKGAARSTIQTTSVKECFGKLDKDTGNAQAFGIRTQVYLNNERTQKLLLLEIPQQQKNVTLSSTKIDVFCMGEIVQSVGSRARGQVVSPNEQFNVSVSIPLRTSRVQFLQPDIETINDITHNKDAINKLDKIIKWISWLTDILQKICKPINVVIQLINSACIAISSITTVLIPWRSAAEACDGVSETFNQLWAGTSGIFDKKPKPQYTTSLDAQYPTWGSSKDWASIGYMCDLVLCQECGTTWNDFVLEGIGPGDTGKSDSEWRKNFRDNWKKKFDLTEDNVAKNGVLTNRDKAIRTAGIDYIPQVTANPFNSIVVATICSPPCLLGIQNKLSVYREILITHNVCVNIAAVRGDAEHAECDKFKRTQWCKQIWGEFFYMIWGVVKQFVVKLAQVVIEKWVVRSQVCAPPAQGATLISGPWVRNACFTARLYEALITLQTIKDAYDAWNSFADQFNIGDASSSVEQREAAIEEQAVGDLCTPGKSIEEGCV